MDEPEESKMDEPDLEESKMDDPEETKTEEAEPEEDSVMSDGLDEFPPDEDEEAVPPPPPRQRPAGIMPRTTIDRRLARIGDVAISDKIKNQSESSVKVIDLTCDSYIKTLANVATVGPEPGRGRMGNKKYVCKDKAWAKNSSTVFSLLYRFMDDLVMHHKIGLTLKNLTTKKKKLAGLKSICAKLQFGNHPAIQDEKEFGKAAESWLPFLYKGDQFVKLMLFLEDWMGAHHNSNEATSERMQIVKAALKRPEGGYSKEEQDTILIAFITIADWD